MTIDVQAILTRSFDILKENVALLVGLTVAGMFIGSFINGMGAGAQAVFTILANDIGPEVALGLGFLARMFGSLVGFVFNSYFGLAMIKIALRLIRGQETTFQDGIVDTPIFLQGLLANFLMSLAIGFGMLFCFVPGIILSLGLIFTMHLTVDQQMGAVDALKKSWEMTDGSKMNIFIWGLVCLALVTVGFLACCVGIVAAAPIILVGTSIIYEQLNGAQSH